jgi:glycosyltransferase involved in cell wall biosynthesis
VLLKTDSIWEQWYYDKLHPWVHYVPVENDFSDLDEKIKWCILHDTECQTIVKNSREFVFKQLNWERVKKDTIGIFQKYIDECFPSNL